MKKSPYFQFISLKYNHEITIPIDHSFRKFLNEFQVTKEKYMPNKEGYLWVNEDNSLMSFIDKYFHQEKKIFFSNSETENNENIINIICNKDVNSVSYNLEANSICVGGLPALWAAYFQSLLFKDKYYTEKVKPPVYIKPINIKNSASYGSSLQYHVSHAMPMYTDSDFSTLNILWKTICRNLNYELGRSLKDNYMIAEIYPKSLFNSKTLKVGLSYYFHELSYKFRELLNIKTIIDKTIPLAIRSGDIMDKVGKILREEILVRSNTIRVAYNKKETKEMINLARCLNRYQIKVNQLNKDKYFEEIGAIPNITEEGSIWEIEGDGFVSPYIFEILEKEIIKNGGKVIEGTVLDIIYDEFKQNIVSAVIKQKDNNDIIIKTNTIFGSLGAKAKFNISKTIRTSYFKKNEDIISATGYSSLLLIEGNIKRPVDSNNSHFTPIKTIKNNDGKYYTLVKATCGGAIGTNGFCIEHAINNLFYAMNILFPNKNIELIAAKSCVRAINGQNSGKLENMLPGLFLGTGFGGKGITDSAAFALDYVVKSLNNNLLSTKLLNNFFNFIENIE